MLEKHVLVVDDLQSKREYLRSRTAASIPRGYVMHTASTTDQAFALIARYREKITLGVIDYDIDKRNGADVIRELRRVSSRARITLATARMEGGSFEEAEEDALAAGADTALSTYAGDFEQRFGAALAA